MRGGAAHGGDSEGNERANGRIRRDGRCPETATARATAQQLGHAGVVDRRCACRRWTPSSESPGTSGLSIITGCWRSRRASHSAIWHDVSNHPLGPLGRRRVPDRTSNSIPSHCPRAQAGYRQRTRPGCTRGTRAVTRARDSAPASRRVPACSVPNCPGWCRHSSRGVAPASTPQRPHTPRSETPTEAVGMHPRGILQRPPPRTPVPRNTASHRGRTHPQAGNT